MQWNWAPQRLLAAIGLAAIAGYGLALLLVLHVPWLGLKLAPAANGHGVRVVSVAPGHANSTRIGAGTTLVAASDPAGGWIPLDAALLLPEPDVLDYARLDRFYAHQDALAAALRQGGLTLRRADGATLRLVTQPRPVTAVSPVFAAHVAYGLGGLLIAAGIWVYRRRQRAAQLLALSGLGFYLCNFGPAVYGGRELALDGELFAALSTINHFGTTLFVVPLVGLMWIYPRPLGRAPVVTTLFAVAAGAWVADWLRLGPSAAYSHYLPLTGLFFISLGFTAAQWRASRRRPAERAALRWIILAMLWATSASVLLVMAPGIFGWQVLPQHLVFAPLLVMYVGVAAGVARYRLFDLEAWWLRTWLWIAGALAVIALDMLLVVVAGLGRAQSLMLSLLLAGFVYFPMRQWLWDHLLPAGGTALDESLPRLTGALIGARDPAELDRRWSQLLIEAFRPLDHDTHDRQSARAWVQADGITLEVPRPLGRGCLVLRYAAGGSRLFNRRDLRLAQALAEVGRYAVQALDARAAGASEERERIMSDLHDDLGAKLLAVVHAARDERDQALARSALADLRSLVVARHGRPAPLARLLPVWRAEFERRVRLAGIEARWSGPMPVPDVQLPGRDAAHIGRILREAVSNAIRHAAPRQIDCAVRLDADTLWVTVGDDGDGHDPDAWPIGRGLRGMRARAEEIGARLTIEPGEAGGIRVGLRYRLQSMPGD